MKGMKPLIQRIQVQEIANLINKLSSVIWHLAAGRQGLAHVHWCKAVESMNKIYVPPPTGDKLYVPTGDKHEDTELRTSLGQSRPGLGGSYDPQDQT